MRASGLAPSPVARRGSLPLGAAFVPLAALAVAFLALPLGATLFSAAPSALLQTLADGEVRRSLGLTFGAGALATALGLLGGVPLAYLLAGRAFRGRALVEALVDLPVVVPHTAAGVALLLVFGRRGLVGGPLAGLGVQFTDSLAGIVAAMLFVSLPFLVNGSREAFARVDPELEEAARVEGASPWQVFRYVALPLAGRGVIAGALMMWARGISEFGAVVILAYHPKIVPVLVYERFEGFGLGAALPVTVVLLVATLALFALLRVVVRSSGPD